MSLNKKEIFRQLIHFTGIWVLFIPANWDLAILGSWLLSISLIAYIAARIFEEQKKRAKHKLLKGALDQVQKLLNAAERERVFLLKGAIMFFVGMGLTMLIFAGHRDIALLSILALAVGDSASTLVGIHLGGTKIWWNRKKSWEGSLAGFAAILIVGSFFFPPEILVLTAFVGTLVELFSSKIDDNISIPLFTGAILFLIRSQTGFF